MSKILKNISGDKVLSVAGIALMIVGTIGKAIIDEKNMDKRVEREVAKRLDKHQ